MMLFVHFLQLLITASITLALPPKFEGSDLQKQYLVTNIPGLYENIPEDKIPLMFAGQLSLYSENGTTYFFWKFSDTNRTEINHNRTIFWLNGGPGCSSMDGALLEVGPFRVNKDGKVIYNEGSWHHAGDVVFVDQPPGTGFSTADKGFYLKELDQVRSYFLEFMKKYFEMFPKESTNEIYLAGESYAGQYIPYIADGILTRNEMLTGEESPYDLRAVMIGNGWISPNEQSLSYFPWFYENGLIDKSNPQFGKILAKVERCQEIINNIDANWNDKEVHDYEISSAECESILTDLLAITKVNGQCINMYDFSLRDSYPSCGMNWPVELKYIKPFLRQEEVMHDLNLKILRTWNECTGKVGGAFTAKNSIPAVHLLPRLTEKIQVLLFNGDRDIICNTRGTLGFLKKLEWGGKKGFGSDEQFNWIYEDENRGYIKSARNMTFVNIYNSSHMVPYDVPVVSRSLIDLVAGNYEMNETSYITYPLGTKKDISDKSADVSKTASASTTPETENKNEPTTNRITRIIQLLVILIILWGLFVLYSTYRSRPSSIIKKGNVSNSNNGNKKKNVQWADQLRRFEDDLEDYIPGSKSEPGFLTRTFNKLTGTNDSRGKYSPASSDYVDEIELAEGISDIHPDEFIIGSDDEEEPNKKSPELEQPSNDVSK